MERTTPSPSTPPPTRNNNNRIILATSLQRSRRRLFGWRHRDVTRGASAQQSLSILSPQRNEEETTTPVANKSLTIFQTKFRTKTKTSKFILMASFSGEYFLEIICFVFCVLVHNIFHSEEIQSTQTRSCSRCFVIKFLTKTWELYHHNNLFDYGKLRLLDDKPKPVRDFFPAMFLLSHMESTRRTSMQIIE